MSLKPVVSCPRFLVPAPISRRPSGQHGLHEGGRSPEHRSDWRIGENAAPVVRLAKPSGGIDLFGIPDGFKFRAQGGQYMQWGTAGYRSSCRSTKVGDALECPSQVPEHLLYLGNRSPSFARHAGPIRCYKRVACFNPRRLGQLFLFLCWLA